MFSRIPRKDGFNPFNFSGLKPEKSPKSERKELVLLDHQIEHCAAMISILTFSAFFNDHSDKGRGKTECQFYVSREMTTGIFIIAPNDDTLNTVWIQRRKRYRGIPKFAGATTYQKLAGRFDGSKSEAAGQTYRRVTNDGWLIRIDRIKDWTEEQKELIRSGAVKEVDLKRKIKTSYELTERMKQAIHNGIILVLDESHATKNYDALATKAVRTITSYIYNSNSPSRVCFLSATPMDKIEQATSKYQVMGIATHNKAFYHLQGYSEGYIQQCLKGAYYYHMTSGLNAFDSILEEFQYSARAPEFYYEPARKGDLPTMQGKYSAKRMLYKMLIDVIIPATTSAMPADPKGHAFRGFIELDPFGGNKNATLYTDAIRRMTRALGMSSGEQVTGTELFQIINKGLGDLETASVDAYCLFLEKKLIEKPTCKVCGAFNRKANLKRFLEYFDEKGYGIRTVHGGINNPEIRESYRKDYQTMSGVCVMGITTAAGGQSIEFDDKIGGEPRIACGSPSYSAISIDQLRGRFDRADTKSAPEFYLLFGLGSDGVTAVNIINNLYEKTDVLRKAISKGITENRKFPGSYPVYIDGAGYIDDDFYATGEGKDVDLKKIFEDVKNKEAHTVPEPSNWLPGEQPPSVAPLPSLVKTEGIPGISFPDDEVPSLTIAPTRAAQNTSLNKKVIASIKLPLDDSDLEDDDL